LIRVVFPAPTFVREFPTCAVGVFVHAIVCRWWLI
jgi:hypothetical protein